MDRSTGLFFTDLGNIVNTNVTVNNPNEDGTCHNYNPAMFAVSLFKYML